MNDKTRIIKQNLLENLLKVIPIIIETERDFGTPEVEIMKMVDSILDRINQLRRNSRKNDYPIKRLKMATNHPSTKEIITLLAKNGVNPSDKDAFVKAFKGLYPSLSPSKRAKLLVEILAFTDSVLEPKDLSAAT